MSYEPIHKETLADTIAHRIEAMIEEGTLKPGEQIPPERDLAKRFRVSRLSVREAVRTLAGRHLLQVRAGEGTFVGSPSAAEAMDPVLTRRLLGQNSFLELMEVRLCVEVEMAGLAALRATQDDRAAMSAAVGAIIAAYEEAGAAFLQADHRFHAAIAVAARNCLLQRILESVNDLVLDLRLKSQHVPGSAARAVAAHRQIHERILDGDSVGARVAMRNHLSQVLGDLKVVLGTAFAAQEGSE